jgi:hypothetical protein
MDIDIDIETDTETDEGIATLRSVALMRLSTASPAR